ncbi:MAG TPA: hypothetical protein VGE04_19005 [Chloroflexia bacterium]
MLSRTWKRTIVLHRPAEELFDSLMGRFFDLADMPDGTTLEVSEGPVGSGTTATWSTPYKNLLVSDTALITEFGPARKISTRSTRSFLPAPGSTSARRYAHPETSTTTIFEPIPGGTRVTVSRRLWFSGVNPLWHPVLLLAYGNDYRKEFHKRMDDSLDRWEGPSSGRKIISFVRQVWSGWIAFALAFLALLWVHAAHAQLGLSDSWLQAVRVAIGLMVVGAFLGFYFIASVKQDR